MSLQRTWEGPDIPSSIYVAIKAGFQSAEAKLQWKTGVSEVDKEAWNRHEGNQELNEEIPGQFLGTSSNCQTLAYFWVMVG